MAGRNTDLRIQIQADAAQAERQIEQLTRSFRQAENAMWRANDAAYQLDKQLSDEMAANARRQAQAQEQLGRGMVAFGAATLAGLGLATKAAIDWESAWAGVRKTVDGSDEEMAALEGELRGLAQTLPASHREIAAVAEAAGQLGVQREAIASFTKVMIDLGETTNLSADEAATAIAQLGNVLGLDLKEDVDNFGSALVALGNDGASTEAQILNTAQRIAGAGAVIGLSADEVLGFAASMANVGIEAEAGGSAMSKVMIDIADSVATGGEKLEVFAEVAGMTVDEFVAAFEEDPARAIAAFVEGLGQVTASGGNTFAVLDSVGLSGIRVRDTLLRLSESTRGVTTDLDLSNTAWEENTALAEEAAKRYDTTEAKISIAKNALVDLAIDIGGVVLPHLANLAESVAGVFRWFSDLPGPVKTLATVFGGLLGALSLVGGGFLLLAPRLKAASELMGSMATTAPRLAGAMSALGRMTGVAVGVGAVAVAVHELWQASKEAAPSIEDATRALLDLQTTSAVAEIQALVDMQNTAREAMDRNIFEKAIDGLSSFGAANVDAGYDTQAFQEHLESFDTAIAGMVQAGAMDKAEESARALQEALGFDDVPFDEFVASTLPAYQDALTGVDNEQRIAGESASGAAEGFAGAGAAAEAADPFLLDLAARFGEAGEGAEKAAQQILDSWSEGFQEFVDIVGVYDEALAAKEEAERDAATATAESTEDASDSWEDYFTDVDLSFAEYLIALEEQVAAQEEWATNMAVLAARGVDDGVLAKLAEMGPAGADLVADAASASDEELQRFVGLFQQSGQDAGDTFATNLAQAGPLWKRIAETQGQETVDELVGELLAGEITWTEILNRYGHLLDDKVPPTQGTDIWVGKDVATNDLIHYGRDADHQTRDRETTVDADTAPASNAIQKFIERENLRKIKLLIEAKLEAFLGNFGFGGGGGGGSGGGSQSGAWRTPMNRGTYRVGGGVGSYPGHTGQDLPAATGTAVYAARTGRVSRSMDMRGSYGRHIYIDHPGGYQTRYAHLSSRGVAAGQMVTTGAYIGRVGSTGNSTGPHLHFELRQGGRVLSPRNYMRFASGGPIEGPGGPRDDQVPVWASNGEFMMQAAARSFYGDKMMHAINDMQLPKLAAGGGIGPTVTARDVVPAAPSVTVVAPQEETVAAVRRELDYWQQATQMVGE